MKKKEASFVFSRSFVCIFAVNRNKNIMKHIGIVFAITLALCLASCSKSDNLRVMSYNVHHCRGIDNKIDYKRIADVINRVAPDFVALQELDSATTRNNGKVCIDELARETGMHASYASAIYFGGGSYGIGILSKEKPIKTAVVPLASRGEARRLLIAEYEKYIVCCTHFALNADDRLASAQIVCDAVKQYKKPLLFAGDMNCVAADPEQAVIGSLFTTLNNPAECTYPSINANECIDYIYAMNNGYSYNVSESRVLVGDSIESDHLPLYVDVQISKK